MRDEGVFELGARERDAITLEGRVVKVIPVVKDDRPAFEELCQDARVAALVPGRDDDASIPVRQLNGQDLDDEGRQRGHPLGLDVACDLAT